MGTFATVPPLSVTQHTLVASTATSTGTVCPEASVVALPPPMATFITVPLPTAPVPWLVQ